MKLEPGRFTSVLEQSPEYRPLGFTVGQAGKPITGLDVPPDPTASEKEKRDAPSTVEMLFRKFAVPAATEVEAAYATLKKLSGTARTEVVRQFEDRYGLPLRDYLLARLAPRPLVGPIGPIPIVKVLVRALGLLTWGTDDNLEVAMGLALIPVGTRDEEVLRVLSRVAVGQRPEFATRYARTFFGLGLTPHDTLLEHLGNDLSGWRHQKAVALLDHDLTQAEHLYFNLIGDHDKAVVEQIQATWKAGVAAFAQLEWDWDRYVRNLGKWTTAAFDERPMGMVLRDELWGMLPSEDWQLVSAVLDAYNAAQGRSSESRVHRPATPPELSADDDLAQLEAARRTLRVASGWTFFTTNAEQVRAAMEAIAQAWKRRIERAKKQGDLETQKQYETEWQKEQAQLNAQVGTWLGGEGKIAMWSHEAQQARIALLTAPNEADRVYATKLTYDFPKIVQVINGVWANGKIDDYRRQATEPTYDASGKILREPFDPDWVIPPTSGHIRLDRRVKALTRENISDTQRGADRLHVEVSLVKSDSDIADVLAFLTTPGLDAKRRGEVLVKYVNDHASHLPGPGPEARFLNALVTASKETRAAGGRGPNLLKVRDVLLPTHDRKEIEKRAKEAEAATHTGTLAKLTDTVTTIVGALNREEYGEVTKESLDRLAWINSATDAEVALLMQLTGTETREALADVEYGAFQERLTDLRAINALVAQTTAGIFEVVVEAALGAALGPAVWIQVFNAVAAAMANIYAQELLLGADYEAISEDNIKAVAQAGLGSVLFDVVDFRTRIAGSINHEKTAFLAKVGEKYGEDVAKRSASMTQNMLAAIADKSTTTVIMMAVDAAIEPKVPTADALGAEAQKLFWNMIGRMTHGPALTYRVNPGTRHDFMTLAQEFRNGFIFKMGVKMTEGVTKKAAELASMDTANMPWEDIFAQLGMVIVKGTASNVVKAAGSAVGQHRTARNRLDLVKRLFHEDPESSVVLAEIMVKKDEKYAADYAKYRDQQTAAGAPIEPPGEWLIGRALVEEKVKLKLHKEAFAPDAERRYGTAGGTILSRPE